MQKDPAFADPNWWLPHCKMYNHMLLQCHSCLTHTCALCNLYLDEGHR
jgi:hypothetical protein